MLSLLARWILNAIALSVVSVIVPGIHIDDFRAALVAVIVIALVNALIKPVLFLLTLPITVLTLGLFSLVINAAMLMIAGSLTSGFRVDGFGAALIGSIVLSIVMMILNSLTR